MKLMLIVDISSLSDNKKLAGKSLLSTKRKLVTTSKLDYYSNIFEKWLSLDIIETVPKEKPEQVHYNHIGQLFRKVVLQN